MRKCFQLSRPGYGSRLLLVTLLTLCAVRQPVYVSAQEPADELPSVVRSESAMLTLERALTVALRQNAAIKTAEERIRRQENVVVEARSFLLPKLALAGEITHIDERLIES